MPSRWVRLVLIIIVITIRAGPLVAESGLPEEVVAGIHRHQRPPCQRRPVGLVVAAARDVPACRLVSRAVRGPIRRRRRRSGERRKIGEAEPGGRRPLHVTRGQARSRADRATALDDVDVAVAIVAVVSGHGPLAVLGAVSGHAGGREGTQGKGGKMATVFVGTECWAIASWASTNVESCWIVSDAHRGSHERTLDWNGGWVYVRGVIYGRHSNPLRHLANGEFGIRRVT
jgi:hypothetical protein